MRAIFARDYTRQPLMVVAREYVVGDTQIELGDLVTVRLLDQDVTFGIRLNARGDGPELWRGTIFHICRGEQSIAWAEGLEIDDIVEISRPEIAEIIKHNDDSGSISPPAV